MSIDGSLFLPVSRDDMENRGWYWYDFLLVTGDAYVDHPSFGMAVISRVLEAEGYRVAILSQPDWRGADDFIAMGKPRLGVFIGAGNLDSMVAHYTAAKKKRSEDYYSPGKAPGLRPDRATIVYANKVREAFGDIPLVIGGLEASLRRFAHYDYWDDKVRRGIIFDARADILVYGMGEAASREIARRLKKKQPLTGIRGTCNIADAPPDPYLELPSFEEVSQDRRKYAEAARDEHLEHDPVIGKTLVQKHGDKYLIVNPPAMPLTGKELDDVYALPYTREYHPMYEERGGVPATLEVQFSVIHNRGCFGACNFCALSFHQGRMVSSRSHESVLAEVKAMTSHPLFKGYVNDIGGPTANLRRPSCEKQAEHGMCRHKKCLVPVPCQEIDASHADYLSLLKKVRAVPGVKKVFVRSGIRYDYMLQDPGGEFFSELVRHHVSGQLKIAPEHSVASVLDRMGKPRVEVYEKFLDKYSKLNQRYGKNQFVVPYLMSSHPGCRLEDAVSLAEYLCKTGRQPEQVQDFYPTPGTISTCMYYTGLDPMTMEPVWTAKSPRDKELQRALLQWKRPEKKRLVLEALKKAGREDLIGYGKGKLVRPDLR